MRKQVAKSDSSESIFSTQGGRTERNAIEVPKIELPKGGGAVRGIDEEFKVNAANGTASFSIPLPVAASRGVAPRLRLAYSSGGGNGIFGLGWDLSLPTIKRKTSQELPQYLDGKGDAADSDTFLLAGGEDLVPEFNRGAGGAFIQNPNGTYQVREHDSLDGTFRIGARSRASKAVFSNRTLDSEEHRRNPLARHQPGQCHHAARLEQPVAHRRPSRCAQSLRMAARIRLRRPRKLQQIRVYIGRRHRF